MDTKKIKAILSAIEYKSFSKAADALSYTPSALSHIADNLEQELGVKIIIRSPLGISLSKEGEELYDQRFLVLSFHTLLTLLQRPFV